MKIREAQRGSKSHLSWFLCICWYSVKIRVHYTTLHKQRSTLDPRLVFMNPWANLSLVIDVDIYMLPARQIDDRCICLVVPNVLGVIFSSPLILRRSVRGWQNLFNYSKVYVRGEKWCLADFVFGEMSGWLPTIPCVRKLYSWEWARMHDHVLLNITKIAFLPGSLQENLYM